MVYIDGNGKLRFQLSSHNIFDFLLLWGLYWFFNRSFYDPADIIKKGQITKLYQN